MAPTPEKNTSFAGGPIGRTPPTCAAPPDHTREEDWLLTDPQSPKSIWWYSDCTDVGFRVVRELDEQAQMSAAGKK